MVHTWKEEIIYEKTSLGYSTTHHNDDLLHSVIDLKFASRTGLNSATFSAPLAKRLRIDCVPGGRLCRLADCSGWPTVPGFRIQFKIVCMKVEPYD
uniref:Uncharacterized protein n=1 Tax=Romanomermis culicivorax TaxID=13658 RepID=A0A915IQB7_ROMCU